MKRAILLLSGGFDSIVACYLMQKRAKEDEVKLDIIAVHFHQVPLTDEKELEKVKELVKKLGVKKVYLVPFAKVLKELVNKCQHKNYFILQKIVMFKTAEIVAEKEGAKCLLTGENLAQVSSQTLSNLEVISSQLKLEILRPLLTFDKQEIIKIAKDIETYEISKGPEICCLLGPKHPATRSKQENIEHELAQLDLKALQEESLNKAEVLEL